MSEEEKTFKNFQSNRRKLESINESAKYLKSNEDRFLGKGMISITGKQRSTKVFNYKAEREKRSNPLYHSKDSSTEASSTGGKMHYSAWKDSFNKKRGVDQIKLNQINEEMSRRYEEKIGNFNLVFPFNKITENLAVEAHKTQNIKNPTKPNYIRMIVNEIKNYIADFNAE